MGQDWLLNNIKARKLSYFGHLKRHDSLERHILETRLEGKRRKGRPTRRWTEDIKKWLQMSPTEAGREAWKREVFRRMVREATSTQTCQDEKKKKILETLDLRMASTDVYHHLTRTLFCLFVWFLNVLVKVYAISRMGLKTDV